MTSRKPGLGWEMEELSSNIRDYTLWRKIDFTKLVQASYFKKLTK